jgi:hypothetical protein
VTPGAEPVFRRDGDAFVPTGHARGPWDEGMQHGGAPSALVARAIEALAPDMALARLSVEFLTAVPLAPVTVEASIAKPGRNLQLAEAALSVDGRAVCRARATLLRRAAVEGLPDGTAPPGLGDGPEDGRRLEFGAGDATEGFHLSGMEIRFTKGAFTERGPATVWFRFARPLVEGEDPTPAQRVVAAADFGNGVSRVLDWRRFLFVNTDLTVLLHRDPVGDWVALDASTAVHEDGRGVASSVLHDVAGSIGSSHQTLFVAPR